MDAERASVACVKGDSVLDRYVIRFFQCASAAVLVCGHVLASPLPVGTNAVPGEVLVKIAAGASGEDIAAIERGADVDEKEHLAKVKSGTIWRMRSRGKNADAVIQALQRNPKVEYAEPNFIIQLDATPNDPLYAQLWGMANIAAAEAWDVTTGSSSVVVGVVDTGINYTHPDLAANVWSNPGGKGNVACAAGTHGYNAVTRTCDPADDHYHGTHVSGTIGAVGNNGIGVAGVNWNVSIMGLKFLRSDGSGTTANAIAAIDFAVQAKIDGVNVRVLSNSWGGGYFSRALLDEINKANENDILFVASAGNSSVNTDTFPSYPAAYNTANMISVAATTAGDQLASFSNYGARSVHLAAPGVAVVSTTPGPNYEALSGTSMAAPHVSGVAALVLAASPSLTTAQVKSRILDNTDPVTALAGKTVTGGRLNAARALGAPPGPDFSLGLTPETREVSAGSPASYTVNVVPANGFSGPVTLSTGGLPFGATATFTPNPATSTSTLEISTSAGITQPGTYPITVFGVNANRTRSAAAGLTVLPRASSVCPKFTAVTGGFIAGESPTSINAADLDRDGLLDITLTNVSRNQVSVLYGLANGQFSTRSTLNVGANPLFVTTGDVDRDGRLDLVTANTGSHDVSVVLANADRSFRTAVSFGAGLTPFAIAMGDFDRDAKLDLAVANNGSGNVSILLGNGNGTFDPAVHYATDSGPFWVTAADVNNDGRLDLVVANYNAGNVSVLLGNGDGTFQARVNYSAGQGAASIAAEDWDGDGKVDLAVANYVGNSLSILRGNGDGSFQPAIHHGGLARPYSVAAGDVNGDGAADLAVANSTASLITLFVNNGTGTFATVDGYATGSAPNQVIAADFNRDGKIDLATANVEGGSASILSNVSQCSMNCGTLAGPVSFTVGTAPSGIAVADFDRDGNMDVAAPNAGSHTASVLLGNGNGSFDSAVSYAVGTAPSAADAADLDGNGRPDLVVANSSSGSVSVLLANTNGTFQPAAHFAAGTNPESVAAGDFNGDGALDVATANRGSNNVSILLSNGNGTLGAPLQVAVGSAPTSLLAADLNRDGKLDLAVANSGSADISVLRGNGDGTFQPALVHAAGTTPVSVASGDLNRDGKLDLVTANFGSGGVSVLLGNGNGTFQAKVDYASPPSPTSVLIADLDRDGIMDVILTVAANALLVLQGVGNGTFNAPVSHPVVNSPTAFGIADFDGNGTPDLAVANEGANVISISSNICPVPDLVVGKSHSGAFAAGDSGRSYTITVTNAGTGPTSGKVTVTEVPPAGLGVISLSGTGWTCVTSTPACSRTDALAPGASYPPITAIVRVASSASGTLINRAFVSGGGETNPSNSEATDPTAIVAATDLTLKVAHQASLTQGDRNKKISVFVSNIGGLATSGSITVTNTLPSGLTPVGISGTGWSCTFATLTCTRNEVLVGTSSAPPIVVTFDVSPNAPSSVANVASVSGGGQTNTNNDIVTSTIPIWASGSCGSLRNPVTHSLNTYYSQAPMAGGDFNRDGHTDFVISSGSYNTSALEMFLGSSNGTFTRGTAMTTEQHQTDLATADFDNDGNLDVAGLSSANNSTTTVSVIIGDGAGGLLRTVNTSLPAFGRKLATGDFDRDGLVDVAITTSTKVVLLRGAGDGQFQAPEDYSVPESSSAIAVGDFNRDGREDLAVGSGGGVSILLGQNDGTFASRVEYAIAAGASSVGISDLNNDGYDDLAMTGSFDRHISVLLGAGNGTFGSPLQFEAESSGRSVAFADFNGDGNQDLAVLIGYGGLTIYVGAGDGTFSYWAAFNFEFASIATGDFDRDGRADVAGLRSYAGFSILLGGCSDVRITKRHSDSFRRGQTSATYYITVSSVGPAMSAGVVTVTDILPAGLTATSISGYGWTCDLPSLTCTNRQSIAAGGSYNDINVQVTVAQDAPSEVINRATVTARNDLDPNNNTATDSTTITAGADLTITKEHSGSFVRGQIGATYTITVRNIGGAAFQQDYIRVTDNLPAGLTATAMSGSGWSCNFSYLECTRFETLAAGASYPPITLTVNVAAGAPPSVVNRVSVSVWTDVNSANNSATDPTTILYAPIGLTATAVTATQVNLTWSAVESATNYEVLRREGTSSPAVVGTTAVNTFVDSSAAAGKVYIYAVRAMDGSTAGPLSVADVASTIVFTDDPVVAVSTIIKAVHLNEVRTAVNAMREAAGLPPIAFGESIAASVFIKASHIVELRNGLDAARAALGLAPLTYIDPVLTPGYLTKAIHLQQLRGGVK